MSDDVENGEGDKFPLSDPGYTADDIKNANLEDLFEIGMGRECDDPSLKREAQTYVATQMRIAGHKYQEIALEMGISLSWGHTLVKRGLKRMFERVAEGAETSRMQQVARCEAMLVGFFDKACDGDTFSAQMVLNIMAKMDGYLGIEAPKRIEHTFTEDAVNDARRELTKAFAALNGEIPDAENPDETTAQVH